MLHISVVSFYDNFNLVIKHSEDMTTKGIDYHAWLVMSIYIVSEKRPTVFPE